MGSWDARWGLRASEGLMDGCGPCLGDPDVVVRVLLEVFGGSPSESDGVVFVLLAGVLWMFSKIVFSDYSRCS